MASVAAPGRCAVCDVHIDCRARAEARRRSAQDDLDCGGGGRGRGGRRGSGHGAGGRVRGRRQGELGARRDLPGAQLRAPVGQRRVHGERRPAGLRGLPQPRGTRLRRRQLPLVAGAGGGDVRAAVRRARLRRRGFRAAVRAGGRDRVLRRPRRDERRGLVDAPLPAFGARRMRPARRAAASTAAARAEREPGEPQRAAVGGVRAQRPRPAHGPLRPPRRRAAGAHGRARPADRRRGPAGPHPEARAGAELAPAPDVTTAPTAARG